MSKKYSLNNKDLKSLAIGLLITLGGALLTYLADNLGKVDLGIYTPFLVPVFALLINLGRKWLDGK